MTISLEDYVSGGYVITKYVDGTAPNRWMRELSGLTEDLLPSKILSVGFCEAQFAPLFEWVGASEKDCTDFGIPPRFLSEIDNWANERFDHEIGYPNIFLKIATAYEYVNRFVREVRELQLLGIGLHKDDLYRIDEAAKLIPSYIEKAGRKWAGFLDRGFGQAIQLGEHPAQGEILGFDVIACRGQIEHSWHCNHLAKDGLEKFGFRPNQFGLIDDKTNAGKLADYAHERHIEDSIWIPVLVTRYPLHM